jgi:hypothetical protein
MQPQRPYPSQRPAVTSYVTLRVTAVRYLPSGYAGCRGWSAAAPASLITVMDLPTSRAALINMGTKVPDWLMAPAWMRAGMCRW